MGTKLWKKGWVKQLAVVVGYLLVHSLVRPFTDGHLSLYAGQRLTFLLLFPYRYWAALVVADVISLSEVALPCANELGITWAILDLIPGVALASPIVWWSRERLALFPTKRLINFQALLICSVLVSLTWTLLNLTIMSFAKHVPGDSTPMTIVWLPAAFLGQYIGVLATVPWALIAKAELTSKLPLLQRFRDFKKSLFAADTLIFVVSAPLFLFWLSHHNHNDTRHISLMAVFLPIAWLMLKPGWRSAALGGTPAILCICALLDSRPDLTVVKIEGFIALTVTCLFALGTRVATRRQQEEQDRLDSEQAIRIARQSIHLNETRLRNTAQALELAGSTLHLTQHQLLARFHSMLPANEAQRYYRQAAATRTQVNQLADSMHPSAWRERGLPAALHETIARVLSEVGITYRCEINGRGLHDLAPGVHTAIYRLACESVVYVNAQMICSGVRLRLRGGITNNLHWVALRVEGRLDPAEINDAVYDTSERNHLAPKLGAYGLGLDALRNHVRLFDGELHERITSKGVRLTYLLIDASCDRELQPGHTPLTINPWVT